MEKEIHAYAHIDSIIHDQKTRDLTDEYYDLTGKVYPAFNGAEWPSADEWYADLKIAVYRKRSEPESAGEGSESETAPIRILYNGKLYTEKDIEVLGDGLFSVRKEKVKTGNAILVPMMSDSFLQA